MIVALLFCGNRRVSTGGLRASIELCPLLTLAAVSRLLVTGAQLSWVNGEAAARVRENISIIRCCQAIVFIPHREAVIVG